MRTLSSQQSSESSSSLDSSSNNFFPSTVCMRNDTCLIDGAWFELLSWDACSVEYSSTSESSKPSSLVASVSSSSSQSRLFCGKICPPPMMSSSDSSSGKLGSSMAARFSFSPVELPTFYIWFRSSKSWQLNSLESWRVSNTDNTLFIFFVPQYVIFLFDIWMILLFIILRFKHV